MKPKTHLQLLQSNFYAFYRYMFGAEKPTNWWVKAFCFFLQRSYYAYLRLERPIYCVEAPVQHGKFLEGNTPVLTTKGWKKHKDLNIGDEVFGEDGLPKKVLANTGVYKWPVNKMTFKNNDGFLLCANEHLWKIQIDGGRKNGRYERILPTSDIFNIYQENAPAINISPALLTGYKKLPIDPYLLGVWLGDGTSEAGNITIGNKDIERFKYLLGSEDIKIKKYGNNYRILIKGLSKKLRLNNLFKNKHIPISYLLADKEQRLELLKGLMDTDGCVDSRGTCEFCQKEGKLAKDVYTLLRTLGFKPTMHRYEMKLYGRLIGYKIRICFNPDKCQQVFNLARKQERIDNKVRNDREDKKRFFIDKIEPYGIVEGNCIQVEGGMYLAGEDLIPTHNSTVLRYFLAWIIGRHPDKRFNFYSADENLRDETALYMQTLLESERYQAIFGGRIVYGNRKQIIISDTGKVQFRIMGGGNVGYPSHFSIIDDPYAKKEDAYSDVYREKVYGRFTADIISRRQNDSLVIITHSRWHVDDLIGHIRENKGTFECPVEFFRYPAIAEEDEQFRKMGEPVFPELRDSQFLKEQKSIMNESEWMSLYQQNPVKEGGNLFKLDWFGFVPRGTMPDKYDFNFMTMDTSYKQKEVNDFTVICYWGVKDSKLYLIDMIRKQINAIDVVAWCESWILSKKEYPFRYIWIEDKGHGIYLNQYFKKHGIVPPEEKQKEMLERNSDKVMRANNIIARINKNEYNVIINSEIKDIDAIKSELLSFPNGKHDDIVDCMIDGVKIGLAVKTASERMKELMHGN